MWDAIAKRCCKQFAVLVMWGCDSEALLQAVRCFGDVWGCDRFWDVGSAIPCWGCWECDSEARPRNQKIKLPHLRMARDPLNLSLHAKPVEPPLVPLELYKKSNSP